MAKPSPIADAIKADKAEAAAEPKPKPVVVDYVCGLRRVGPSQYVVVSGLVRDGVPDLRVEEVAQSLDHAAEELRSEFQRLVEFVPAFAIGIVAAWLAIH